jgi:DNA-binding transcriptional MerR regulator
VAATHARRSASLPKEKNPYAWEEAIREIDELLDLLDELPEAAEDFVDSVREQADDMQSWIAGHEHVTEAQQTTIANWAAGASRWLEH